MVETVTGIFREGGVTLVVIVLMSVGALAIGLERLVAIKGFRRRMATSAERIVGALDAGDLAKARAIVTAGPQHPGVPVFDALLAEQTYTAAQVRRMQQKVVRRMRAGAWLLGTIAATAPFVGLFGTVRGIMEAFAQIGAQGAGGFDVVSAGISEALITTAGGILVGVEAMFLFNYLQSQGSELIADFKDTIEEIREAMEASRGSASAAN
jgi:biopolymer transport protein ExbB